LNSFSENPRKIFLQNLYLTILKNLVL